MNEELAAIYDELDGLLKATLSVDDYVDLEALRVKVDHPPFDRADLETPLAPPVDIPDLVEPQRVAVPPSKAIFGREKKTAAAQAQAEAEFLQAHEAWWHANQALPAQREAAATAHAGAESARVGALATERARYEAECAERESEVASQNAALDTLIANLGYGAVDAVREYVGIVLANSVYPEHFDVEHDADFEPSTSELRVRAIVPDPSKVPTLKGYKYAKATDQVSPVELTARDAKARYASIVQQVALRTIHEVYEADRRNIIQAITLEVGAETNEPATGQKKFIPFVAVAVARDQFMSIDLSGVVPSATLEHLGAAVSRSPFDLVAANTSGIRRV